MQTDFNTDDYRLFFQNKKVLIMGLGLLGRGLNDARFIAQCGARVTITDLKTEKELASSIEQLKGYSINYVLGGHCEKDFKEHDLIIKNAGVRKSSPFLKIALDHGIPIEMDESLFCRFFKGLTIGITGTRGKSTTTSLIYQIFKQAGKDIYLGGNVKGLATLPLLAKVKNSSIVVMELSSWQLQGFGNAKISPQIAVFTNFYEDHLNYYQNMDEYFADKKQIMNWQKENDFLLLNQDDKKVRELHGSAKGNVGFFCKSDIPDYWQIKVPGDHNLYNLAAALKISDYFKISKETVKEVFENYHGEKHRLQYIRTINGVDFINDTTSTTPVAGCAALASFPEKNIILIMGGADKKLDLTPFVSKAVSFCKSIILLEGTATGIIQELIKKYNSEQLVIGLFSDFSRAIETAKFNSEPGDIVLLSPGCASFGMFKNEFDRGEQFIRIVESMS